MKFCIVTSGLDPFYYQEHFDLIGRTLSEIGFVCEAATIPQENSLNIYFDLNCYLAFDPLYRDFRYCLFQTEFEQRFLGVPSFNWFSGNSWHKIRALVRYQRLKILGKRDPAQRVVIDDLVREYAPTGLVNFLSEKVAPLRRRLRNFLHRVTGSFRVGRLLGDRNRFNQFQRARTDALFTMAFSSSVFYRHDDPKNIVLWPSINVLYAKGSPQPTLVISGTLTRFRKRSLRRILYTLGRATDGDWVSSLAGWEPPGRHHDAFREISARHFSFHPPQTAYWAASSPVRILRSIEIQETLPVVAHRFGDHEVEKVCLTPEELVFEIVHAAPSDLIGNINSRIERYNSSASEKNLRAKEVIEQYLESSSGTL